MNQIKYTELSRLLLGLGRFALALSGGLDSRFLARAAVQAKADFVALTATGPHLSTPETRFAGEWAVAHGLKHHFVPVDVLDVPDVAANNKQRCYGCKRTMFGILRDAVGDMPLLDGTHAGDLLVFRPGLRALRELGVRSPLAEIGLDKNAIRQLAKETGLDHPDQAARPCLLTRLEYGMKPEAPMLRRIEAAETAIEALAQTDFRLRIRADLPALLQVTTALNSERERAVRALLAGQGFPHVEILLTSSISGFFDR